MKAVRRQKYKMASRTLRPIKYFGIDLKNILLKKRSSKSYFLALKKVNINKKKVSRQKLFKRILQHKQLMRIFFGNLKEKRLKFFIKNYTLRSFFPKMELRLDNFLQRLPFFSLNYFFIRQFIRLGLCVVNNKSINKPNFVLKINSTLSFNHESLFFFESWLSNFHQKNKLSYFAKQTFSNFYEFSPSLFTFIITKQPSAKDLFYPFRANADTVGMYYRLLHSKRKN